MPPIEPRIRAWLTDGGDPVFGEGICDLLRGVIATGSLHRAAAQMKMAYSKAWTIVSRAEERLGLRLVERRVGGPTGGGSIVTEEGRALVDAFDRYVAALRLESDRLFREIVAPSLGDEADET